MLLAAENEPLRSGRAAYPEQLTFERGSVDVPVAALGGHHDVGERLAPRQFVGMVLDGPDEHDGLLLDGEGVVTVIPGVQARGTAQPEDTDQIVERPARGGVVGVGHAPGWRCWAREDAGSCGNFPECCRLWPYSC